MPVEASPSDRNDVSAAILAGGKGSRVGGQDKGLLLLAGRPLVGWVVESLRGCTTEILICANRNRKRYAEFGKVVDDVLPGFRGPLAGIGAALRDCRSSWLLTVPVDCPRPPADLASRLGQAVVSSGATAAVAHTGLRREPLFAIYSIQAGDTIAAALDRNLAVWRWQDELGAIEVDFSANAGAFGNLNEAGDFRRWEHDHDD
jgi:molybdenum cofactor guanylyltransferase